MSSFLLVTISSDLHVLAQCDACFILFATSKQNGLNKNSFRLKCCCRDSALWISFRTRINSLVQFWAGSNLFSPVVLTISARFECSLQNNESTLTKMIWSASLWVVYEIVWLLLSVGRQNASNNNAPEPRFWPSRSCLSLCGLCREDSFPYSLLIVFRIVWMLSVSRQNVEHNNDVLEPRL